MNRIELDGDPWVAQWVAPDGTVHKLYEADVALLRKVAADRVETDDKFPRWVFVDCSRCTIRDPMNRTFRRLVDLGIIVAGESEYHPPARPEFSSSGTGSSRTPYRLVDTAAEAMLAAVR